MYQDLINKNLNLSMNEIFIVGLGNPVKISEYKVQYRFFITKEFNNIVLISHSKIN